MMGDKEEEQSFEGPPEEEGKYDKEVMDLEFKKYNSKDSKKKTSTSASEPSKPSNKHTAKPVNQRGKITKEQMLTAPHSPYFEVRVGQAVFLRQAANDEYAVDNIGEAIKLYERALYHCDFTDSKIGFEQTEEQKQSLQDATDPIYLNLARCYLKQKEYQKAITNAKAGVHENSTELSRTKARFLEGKALYYMKEYDNALKVLEIGANSINDETERKGNTNLLQQSLLQADYQELIRLAREGQSRHRAHDVKVWKGVLQGSAADDSQSKSHSDSGSGGTSKDVESSPLEFAPMFLVGVLMLMIAVYFGRQ